GDRGHPGGDAHLDPRGHRSLVGEVLARRAARGGGGVGPEGRSAGVVVGRCLRKRLLGRVRAAAAGRRPLHCNCFHKNVYASALMNAACLLSAAPPRDRERRQRSYLGRRKSAPCQTQFSFSWSLRASRSSTVSQFGWSLRYSSRVVRRQSPRGFL